MKTIKLHLADHGQDFLEFTVENGVIVETGPLQGWFWNGRSIKPPRGRDHFRRGDRPLISMNGDFNELKYPVLRVDEIGV